MPEDFSATIDEYADELASGGANTEEEQQPGTPPPPPSLDSISLDGDSVPELLRGKTVADALKTVEALQAALKTSEQARQQPAQPYYQQPPQPPQQDAYDRQRMQELYDQDPLAAMEQMGQYLARQLDQSVATRLQPLQTGISSTAEAQARQQYAEDFELFGDQIREIAGTVPAAALTSKKSWDDLISYVRGQPGNFDKMLQKRMQKEREAELANVRAQEQQQSGYTGRPRPAGAIQTGGDDAPLDPVADKIAQDFIDQGVFKSKAEYRKWAKA